MISTYESFLAPSRGALKSSIHQSELEKAKFIPLRLTVDERKLLKICENALNVSEYTDNVDIFYGARKKKGQRMIENLVDLMNICLGLLVARDLTKGEAEMKGKDLVDNLAFFKDMFEVVRRYKIMNPSKLRGNYGKMMWIIMDTESAVMKAACEVHFDLIKPILTVYSFLEERGMLAMLQDPLLWGASVRLDGGDSTPSVVDGGGCDDDDEKDRARAVRTESRACMIAKYSSDIISEDEINRLINSISDNDNYLSANAGPVDQMLSLLITHFDETHEPDERKFSLALSQRGGKKKIKDCEYGNSFSSYLSGYSSSFMGSGAQLSHTHQEQYMFVLQSLTLWQEIMRSMPRLWTFADKDMLAEFYHVADTGQGYHRMQSCPTVRSEMNRILSTVKGKFGRWIGLSVVHLGDRDVPNALVFIDKYTQVPNILGPISLCLQRINSLCMNDKPFLAYVTAEWGGVEQLKMQILSDFFKHGFDGSGDDGGSCIDGRLTSAWNWCSKLEKKPFYHCFMWSGFQGFDGDGFE
jgi:hypothetical protein